MQPANLLVELRRVLSPADAPLFWPAITEDDWSGNRSSTRIFSILS